MLIEKEDTELLSLFRNKITRTEGFKLILEKYQQKIYYFMRRMNLSHKDADELVQDVFVNFWKLQNWLTETDQLNLKLYQPAGELCLKFIQGHKEVDLKGLTFEHEEFDYSEIAGITHFPIGEVKGIFKAVISKKTIIN
jgi:hypothetical protein